MPLASSSTLSAKPFLLKSTLRRGLLKRQGNPSRLSSSRSNFQDFVHRKSCVASNSNDHYLKPIHESVGTSEFCVDFKFAETIQIDGIECECMAESACGRLSQTYESQCSRYSMMLAVQANGAACSDGKQAKSLDDFCCRISACNTAGFFVLSDFAFVFKRQSDVIQSVKQALASEALYLELKQKSMLVGDLTRFQINVQFVAFMLTHSSKDVVNFRLAEFDWQQAVFETVIEEDVGE